jgi:hypothetical protein
MKSTLGLFRLILNQLQCYLFFFLCLFLRKRFLRLCVAILCLLRFLPLGISLFFKGDTYFTLALTLLTKVFAGLNEGIL